MSESPASQYTGTFLELLDKANKSLVVSTYQASKLVVLRVRGNDINTHFVDIKKPMGMAFQNDRLSVGSGNSVIDYFNSANAAAKIAPGNSHDAAFLPRRAHITGDIDIHEMAFDSSDKLWIVNTRMSCLCTLDVKHSFVPQWRPPFISAYDGTDRCHLNGLAMRNGKPRYVTALGATDQPAGWRDNKALGGILMDIEANKIIADGLSMPHSPRWYRNKLWVLESGSGELLSVDEATGEKVVVAEVPGFCRGLDFMERYAVIGLSEVRETAIFAGLPLTQREQDRKCGIWVVDIETGQSVAYLVFTSGVQEIFSVQCLPMRYPALLDSGDKLLDTTYSVPGSVIDEFVPPDPRQIKTDRAAEHHRRKEYVAAIDLYRSILEDEPGDTHILYCLGDALARSGQWDEAIACMDKVVSAQDSHARAHNVRGHYFRHKNELARAIECYDKAISIDRQFAAAYFHRGCTRLMQGNFERGWEDYEWRTKVPGFKTFSLPRPEWHGEDISDKTLLVLTEENLGDAILFARFLPMAKQRCKKLILICDESLRLLFKGIDGVDEVRAHGKLQSDLFDVYASIASLGAVLKVDADSLATKTPYLEISKHVVVPDLRASKKQRVNVGLVWSGSPGQNLNHDSSCPLDDMISLTDNPDADFFAFQPAVFAKDRKILEKNKVTDLEHELGNYARMAALIQQMDLMVSVSSATAQLSGALGVPTVVLLSDQADWRWMGDGTGCTWYPSVEVLRQKGPGDWSGVLEQCAESIQKHAAESGRHVAEKKEKSP